MKFLSNLLPRRAASDVLPTGDPGTHDVPAAAAANPALEVAIDRVLANPPEPAIPADFAARVRASLPVAAPVRWRPRFGRQSALYALAVLLPGLFWLAPHTAPRFSSLAFDVQLLLLVETGCIASCMAWKRRIG